MTEENPSVKIDIKKDLLSNKKYNSLAISYGKAMSITEETYPKYSLKDFKKNLRTVFNMSKYNIKTTIDTLINMGAICIEGDNIVFSKVSEEYIVLDIATIVYYSYWLSDNAFKIFCYLFSKYSNKDYYFSYRELLEVINYQYNKRNCGMLDVILKAFVNSNILEYSEGKYVQGYRGKRHEILSISNYVDHEKKHQALEQNKILETKKEIKELSSFSPAMDWNKFLAENLEKFKDDAWLFFCNDKEKACEFWDETCKGTVILPHEWNDLGVYVQNYRHERYK